LEAIGIGIVSLIYLLRLKMGYLLLGSVNFKIGKSVGNELFKLKQEVEVLQTSRAD